MAKHLNEQYLLRLYVNGRTARSRMAEQNLRSYLNQHLRESFDLEVVDVQKDVEEIQKNNLLGTPTLIKFSPKPVSRVVGDMSDTFVLASVVGSEPQK